MLSSLAAAAMLALNPLHPSLCALPALRAVSCVETPHGAVIGAGPEEGRRLGQAARAGEAHFAIRFGRAPSSYAVLLGRTPQAVVEALVAAGVAQKLPWASEAERRAVLEAGMLETFLKRPEFAAIVRGLDPATAREVMREALTESGIEFEMDIDAGSIMTHELGHGWLEGAFAFPEPATPQDRYGTTGPDWLDEAAAVILEGETAAETRRAEFRKAWQAGSPPPDPLTHFLTREHPGGEGAAPAFSTELGRTTTATETTVTTFSAGPEPSGLFYPQTQVFIDFLLSRTRDPAVLGEIATALAAGGDLQGWLANSAAGRRLGGTLKAMEAAWNAWLVQEYGRRGPPPP